MSNNKSILNKDYVYISIRGLVGGKEASVDLILNDSIGMEDAGTEMYNALFEIRELRDDPSKLAEHTEV